MTQALYAEDAYLRSAPAELAAVTETGHLVLRASLFYPAGGGQPGDRGALYLADRTVTIIDCVKGEAGSIELVPAPDQILPAPGAGGSQTLDWPRRHQLMRMHTALHL
ncbi:MAG: alanyl-tRNA editing protein, partial [Pseudomonadota bacterium]